VAALGNMGDARALDDVVKMLNDTHHFVRASAAVTLGRLKDNRAVEPLIAALKDTEASVRAGAALSLGELKDRRAIEPLEKLLASEKNENVRQQAEYALQQLRSLLSQP
jgi:HEAT repeat protein